MAESLPRRRRKEQEKPVHALAISYQRVSTAKQSEKEKSSYERQLAALESFKQVHPGIEVRVEPIRESISGNKKNVSKGLLGRFLRDAQNKRVPPGTVLVTESTDRLTRAGINDGLKLLIDLFEAGVAVCFTDFENEIHTGLSHNVYRIAGSLDGAGKLSADRKRNSEGAIDKKYRLIEELADGKRARFGKNYFRPRGSGNTKPGYPCWLDVTEDSEYGEWMIDEHWATAVRKAFRMAAQPGNGVRNIVRALQADGYKSPSDNKKRFSEGSVKDWLGPKSRRVLGEYIPSSKSEGFDNSPITNVFPPIVSEAEWEAAMNGIRSRGGRGAEPMADGTRPPQARTTVNRGHKNLFQGQSFCGRCGSLMGTTGQSNGRRLYLQCSGRVHRRNDCDAPNVLYEEELWLKSIQGFRWDQYFSDSKHEAEVYDLRNRILKATGEVDSACAATAKAQEKIELANPTEIPVRALIIWTNQLETCEADQREAEHELRKLQGRLASMQSRKSSREKEKEVRQKIEAFIKADRSDPIKRAEFHAWFSEHDLVLVLDAATTPLRQRTCSFGLGRWVKGELVEINETLEIASSNGAPKENLIQLEKDMARRKAHLDQQFAEAEKLQAEKERNRKPMPEAELLKRRKALEEFIEQRDKVLADNPRSSDWPQPEKAWGDVDRDPLRQIEDDKLG